MISDEIKERLTRIETKVDFILTHQQGQRAKLNRLEGRVWGLVILFLTAAIGIVGAFVTGLR